MTYKWDYWDDVFVLCKSFHSVMCGFEMVGIKTDVLATYTKLVENFNTHNSHIVLWDLTTNKYWTIFHEYEKYTSRKYELKFVVQSVMMQQCQTLYLDCCNCLSQIKWGVIIWDFFLSQCKGKRSFEQFITCIIILVLEELTKKRAKNTVRHGT